MHLVRILGKGPTWRTFLLYMFISILYKFRATSCSSSGESIVSIQHLVYVTVYRVQVSDLHTIHSNIYQMLYWYNWFSWWWARGCSKLVENWNKYINKYIYIYIYIYKRIVREVGHLPRVHRSLNILLFAVLLQSLGPRTAVGLHLRTSGVRIVLMLHVFDSNWGHFNTCCDVTLFIPCIVSRVLQCTANQTHTCYTLLSQSIFCRFRALNVHHQEAGFATMDIILQPTSWWWTFKVRNL